MNPLSLIALVAGFVFAVCGLIFRMLPPKKINALSAHRTGSSQLDPETWQLANNFAARLMLQLGLLLLAFGGITFILPPTPFTGVFAGIGLVLLTAFMQFYFTERHLRKNFDKHGNRRK